VPHPLDARHAHAMRPASVATSVTPGAKRRRNANSTDGAVTAVVLDDAAVLADMVAIGAGLVDGCLVREPVVP